jgi:hypothetical protein
MQVGPKTITGSSRTGAPIKPTTAACIVGGSMEQSRRIDPTHHSSMRQNMCTADDDNNP